MSASESSKSSESSVKDYWVRAEDLPSLAQSLPAGNDASFFTNCARLPAPDLPPESSFPDEVIDLLDKEYQFLQQLFNSAGKFFRSKADYQSAVVSYVLRPLLISSFKKALFYDSLAFWNDVAADGVITHLTVGYHDYLKLILEFKSPAEDGGGIPRTKDLALQIGQAFAYAKYAYIDNEGEPYYKFGSTVYHHVTLSS